MLVRMKLSCQLCKSNNLIFYATHLICENERAEKILLKITGALVIPVRHRQEHGQDVYTARCKHFHWPSLNNKKKSQAKRSLDELIVKSEAI